MKTIFLLLFTLCSSAFAACHAVTIGGAGSVNGTNWSNAYNKLPGSLVRGDTYYFADGTYGSYTFSQAASGTSVITFQKAQSYNYGRTSDGCSNDISAGWNAATMGAGQLAFTSASRGGFTISSSYLTINGNGQLTAPGCGGTPGAQNFASSPSTLTDCGFSFQGLGGTSTGATNIIFLNSGTNVTIEYAEIFGSGTNDTGGNGTNEIVGSAGIPLLLSHVYGHNCGCVYLQDLGSGTTVTNSYFWGTEVAGAPGGLCHGQAEFETGGTNNGVRSNNIYRDIVGTAIWTFAASVGTNDNWTFYNNIGYYSPSGAVTTTNGSSGSCPSNCVTLSSTATDLNSFILTAGGTVYLGSTASTTTAYTVGTVYSASLLSVTTAPGTQSTNYFTVPFGGTSDAFLDCINGNLCTNFTYVQNTVINCIQHGAFGAECGIGFNDGASGCSLTMENNLWYGNPGAVGLTKCASMTLTEDYNSFLNTTNFGTGAHDVGVSSGAANPFVNWPAGNFALTADSSNYNNRVSLGTPTVDIFGTAYSTDRGAVQYMSAVVPTGGSAPGPGAMKAPGATSGDLLLARLIQIILSAI